MAISNIWTDPAGFSVDEASAAVSGSAAAAGGAALDGTGAAWGFAGAPAAALSAEAAEPAAEPASASSTQRAPTTELRAPASSALARGLSGLIVPATVASGLGAVKMLVSGSTRACGDGHSARALAIEDGGLRLFGGEAESVAGGEASGAVRTIFSLASPTYQQVRLVARSTR
jgi:hypothetical protein